MYFIKRASISCTGISRKLPSRILLLELVVGSVFKSRFRQHSTFHFTFFKLSKLWLIVGFDSHAYEPCLPPWVWRVGVGLFIGHRETAWTAGLLMHHAVTAASGCGFIPKPSIYACDVHLPVWLLSSWVRGAQSLLKPDDMWNRRIHDPKKGFMSINLGRVTFFITRYR